MFRIDRRVHLICALAVLAPAANAGAGQLQMIGGQTYTGSIVRLDETDATFLWQQDKDQPDVIKKGKGDLAYAAQGSVSETRAVPLADIETIDKVPVERYPALFGFNLFYRVFNDLDCARIKASSTGDFINQLKGISIFILLLLLVAPLLMTFASIPFSGDKIGFFGALGMIMVLTAGGFGAAMASQVLTTSVAQAGIPGVQIAITLVLGVVFAGVISMTTRYGFFQGVAFVAVWGATLLGIARLMIAVVVGAGGETHQIY